MYGFKEITADQLQQLISEGQSVQLIDVRSPAEVARGVIGGARHVPLHTLPIQMGQLSKEQPVVFYCLSGGRSSQACAFAAAQGFTEVYNLRGGVSAWANRGLPLDTPA